MFFHIKLRKKYQLRDVSSIVVFVYRNLVLIISYNRNHVVTTKTLAAFVTGLYLHEKYIGLGSVVRKANGAIRRIVILSNFLNMLNGKLKFNIFKLKLLFVSCKFHFVVSLFLCLSAALEKLLSGG